MWPNHFLSYHAVPFLFADFGLRYFTWQRPAVALWNGLRSARTWSLSTLPTSNHTTPWTEAWRGPQVRQKSRQIQIITCSLARLLAINYDRICGNPMRFDLELSLFSVFRSTRIWDCLPHHRLQLPGGKDSGCQAVAARNQDRPGFRVLRWIDLTKKLIKFISL